MIERLVEKAKELQKENGVLVRLDIQFNSITGEYTARAFYHGRYIDLKYYTSSIVNISHEYTESV